MNTLAFLLKSRQKKYCIKSNVNPPFLLFVISIYNKKKTIYE